MTESGTNIDKVLAAIIDIVQRIAKPTVAITSDTVLQEDVGLTSLQVMDLVLEVEEEFDISFPMNRLPDIQTAGDLATEVHGVIESSEGNG